MTSVHPDLVIRESTMDDAPAIGLMVDEFRSYLHGLGDLHACVNFGAEQYRRDGFGPNPAFFGFIALRSGVAAGYALYSFGYSTDTGCRSVFLHDLFVRAVHRGEGIGEALFNRVLDVCRAEGGDSMEWLVWHTNDLAIDFYVKMGARTVETVRLMRIAV